MVIPLTSYNNSRSPSLSSSSTLSSRSNSISSLVSPIDRPLASSPPFISSTDGSEDVLASPTSYCYGEEGKDPWEVSASARYPSLSPDRYFSLSSNHSSSTTPPQFTSQRNVIPRPVPNKSGVFSPTSFPPNTSLGPTALIHHPPSPSSVPIPPRLRNSTLITNRDSIYRRRSLTEDQAELEDVKSKAREQERETGVRYWVKEEGGAYTLVEVVEVVEREGRRGGRLVLGKAEGDQVEA